MTRTELIAESLRIEGIHRAPTEAEEVEFDRFMVLDRVTVEDVVHFVRVYDTVQKLRTEHGMEVWIGGHKAPGSGPAIGIYLEDILCKASAFDKPYSIHHEYEQLHPFTDCNGRSGRMLWYWMMRDQPIAQVLGFLHTWYYQSLSEGRR